MIICNKDITIMIRPFLLPVLSFLTPSPCIDPSGDTGVNWAIICAITETNTSIRWRQGAVNLSTLYHPVENTIRSDRLSITSSKP